MWFSLPVYCLPLIVENKIHEGNYLICIFHSLFNSCIIPIVWVGYNMIYPAVYFLMNIWVLQIFVTIKCLFWCPVLLFLYERVLIGNTDSNVYILFYFEKHWTLIFKNVPTVHIPSNVRASTPPPFPSLNVTSLSNFVCYICIFLTISKVEHLFILLLMSTFFLLWNDYAHSLTLFLSSLLQLYLGTINTYRLFFLLNHLLLTFWAVPLY